MFQRSNFIFSGIDQKVICHGDLWAANILWTQTDGGFIADKVLDYQVEKIDLMSKMFKKMNFLGISHGKSS